MLAAAEFGFSFHDPRWLWLLVLLPLLVVARIRGCVGTAFAAAAFVREPAPLPRSWRLRLRGLPFALELVALLLGTVALARPVHTVPLPPERAGRDVLLCLDRSSSMAATDLAPERTRLAVAIAAAREFVSARSHDRCGFVQFARYADLRCPPTLDHDAVAELLGTVTMVTKDGPEDATGIGGAIAAAAAVLQRSNARSRVIVLVTDGEENVANAAAPAEIAPLHAAQLCRELGIRVHTIVVGRGNLRSDGRFVPLDPTAVRQLAATTGGRFATAGDAAALRTVLADIDALEVTVFAEPRVLRREGFVVVLAAAIVALLLGHVLARTSLGVIG